MFFKNILKIFGICVALCFIALCLNVNYTLLFEMPSGIHLSLDDLEDLNNLNSFGNFVTAEINDNIISVGGERRHNTKFCLKLFGLIPIRQVNAIVEDEKEVYLGGIPLGFSINTNGLLVVGKNSVGDSNGINPFKTGDIITGINGFNVSSPDEVLSVLESLKDDVVTVSVLRNGQNKEVVAVRMFDESVKEYKLGLWVRNDAQGVGTLTFVTKDGSFGALGHSINDYETGVEIPVRDGGIYLCNLVGINKAQKHKSGELRCLFSQTKQPIGSVEKNVHSGVFGKTDRIDELVDKNLCAKIGSRMLVKLGRAKIVSSVSGVREEYDIEIIKAKYQPKSSDKSFVFRVIDKRLIGMTGGIVQGMSGSPIVQNGKIIGAVTHVFLNDATKGYGIYVDWMFGEMAS